ncbi:MAG TPA: ABC transporter substrate-binding protein, partial [Patescibacteria group bacterium]|nr:ABC transporter substrate-binding protein [Patescibacteria group bacterium]
VNGRPKLDQFFMNIYANQNKMYEDFKNKSLTAIAAVNTPPSSVFEGAGVIKHNLILRAANMVFFKTSTGVLGDQSVRQALGEATNQKDILNKLGYMTVPVKEPLLIGQLGYNPIYAQSPFNLSAAKQKLMSDGWTSFKKGVRQKNNQFLNFTLVAANTTENQTVTKILKSNWQKLGVNLTIQLQNQTDFQQSLTYHDYDAVLTSITIGSDPDVFVYWDSSQADIRSANRLNLSEYKNPIVDVAVESGRTRIDPTERIIKYQSLLSQWQQDTPAVGLFQPRLLYLTNGPVGAIDNQSLNTSIDRFDNVQDWAVKQAKVSPN